MKRIALFTCGLFLILLLTASIGGPVAAATREMPPLTEVPVNLRLVDEEKRTLTGEKTVTIEVTRGGLKDPAVLNSGLRIKDGIGQFVYITPATPGPAEIKIIDPETGKILEKIVFYIIEPEPPLLRDETVLVTQVAGRAEIQPGNRLLHSGEKVTAGVAVITVGDSWVNLELLDGSRIIVQPGTVLRFSSVKRGVRAGKEVRLNLVSGQIFITAHARDFAGESSILQVRTPGADFYARNGAFEFAVSNKGAEAVVYQGELLIEDGESGLLFPVAQGEKALLPTGGGFPNYSSHRLTAEMREDILRIEGFLSKESTVFKASPDFTFRTGGSFTVMEGFPYAIFKLKPQFYKTSGAKFSVGLELPFVFDQSTGILKLGSLDRSINLGPVIDWVKFENDFFFLNYGFFEEGLTYGYGLLFGDYVSKSNFGDVLDNFIFLGYIDDSISLNYTGKSTRRTHFGIHTGDGLRIEVLAPWNIRNFSSGGFDSNSLYVVRLEEAYQFSRSHLGLGLTYITDGNFKRDLGPYGGGIADQGLAFDAGFFITETFQPYMEAAVLKLSSSAYGLGVEAGVLGKTSSFRYRVGLRSLGKWFHPNYFGGDYELKKADTLNALFDPDGIYYYERPLAPLNDPVYHEAAQGFYIGVGVTAGKILSLDLSFEDTTRNDPYFPLLTGKLELTLPSLGLVPAISAGVDYRCYQFSGFDSIPDVNTVYTGYIEAMLTRGVFAIYKKTYIPQVDQSLQELSLEVRW